MFTRPRERAEVNTPSAWATFTSKQQKEKIIYDGKNTVFPPESVGVPRSKRHWTKHEYLLEPVCAVYIWYTVNTESARSWCSVSRAFSVTLSLSAWAIISFNPSHWAAWFLVKNYSELRTDCVCMHNKPETPYSIHPYSQTSHCYFTRVLHNSRYVSHVFICVLFTCSVSALILVLFIYLFFTSFFLHLINFSLDFFLFFFLDLIIHFHTWFFTWFIFHVTFSWLIGFSRDCYTWFSFHVFFFFLHLIHLFSRDSYAWLISFQMWFLHLIHFWRIFLHN